MFVILVVLLSVSFRCWCSVWILLFSDMVIRIDLLGGIVMEVWSFVVEIGLMLVIFG